ncbi:MAG: hypothetical protein FJ303_00185 [Planctomycetes bacterium]|nr:hypothetical protein [Planctomycetota bacterium]
MTYTCTNCGIEMYITPPTGDTTMERLSATALYCASCDELVCVGCGLKKLAGEGTTPCGMCGGDARTIDVNRRRTWYPGERPKSWWQFWK